MKPSSQLAGIRPHTNIDARRSEGALASLRIAFSLAIAGILLTGCVHDPLVLPSGPGGAIAAVSNTGVYLTGQGHALWLKEGCPPDLFAQTPNGWFMTSLQFHEGNEIRLDRENGVKP